MAANSSNPERGHDVADNQMYIRVPLSVTADWKVTGKSEPAIVEYNITEPLPEKYKVEDQIGPEVVHIYDVKNKGPATIKEAEVFIMWPSFTKDDQRHLLYLLGVNYDPKDKVTCQPIRNINPLYIKTKESVGYAQALQEVLEMDGEVRKTLYSSSSYSSSNSGGWSSGGSSSRTSYNSGSTKYQTSNTGRTEENQRLGGGSTSFSSGSSSSEINGGNTRYGSVSRVAEGAEETQLIDETATNTNANNRRTQTSSSSSTSFGVSSTSTGSGLGATSGWKLLPNGTYIRIYDSRSTSGGSSSYSSGSSSTLGSSSRGSNAGADSNLNTVLGAAQGPGDYRGTMRKTELEKEAGGSVFSSTNQETRNQVETTRFQGNTGSIGGSSSSSSNSYYDSSRSTTYGAEYDQENDDDDYDEDYSYSSRSGNGRRYGGSGRTQYEEGSYFDQDQGQNSGRNSAASSSSSSSSSTYSSSSSSSSSSFGGSEDSSASSASAGRWVWSDATGKWEWSTTTGAASESSKTGKQIMKEKYFENVDDVLLLLDKDHMYYNKIHSIRNYDFIIGPELQ